MPVSTRFIFIRSFLFHLLFQLHIQHDAPAQIHSLDPKYFNGEEANQEKGKYSFGMLFHML